MRDVELVRQVYYRMVFEEKANEGSDPNNTKLQESK
jgi:hypothetical protein